MHCDAPATHENWDSSLKIESKSIKAITICVFGVYWIYPRDIETGGDWLILWDQEENVGNIT